MPVHDADKAASFEQLAKLLEGQELPRVAGIGEELSRKVHEITGTGGRLVKTLDHPGDRPLRDRMPKVQPFIAGQVTAAWCRRLLNGLRSRVSSQLLPGAIRGPRLRTQTAAGDGTRSAGVGGHQMQRAGTPGWEHFQHIADIGVRGCGRSPAEAFEQVAMAMTAVILDPAAVICGESLEIEVSAPDHEILLTEWLNALIYEMATRHMLFARFEVEIRGDVLKARAWGETIDVTRHRPTVEIKGATFTELRVWRSEDGLCCAQCVVDV